jgi:hypothetical protein
MKGKKKKNNMFNNKYLKILYLVLIIIIISCTKTYDPVPPESVGAYIYKSESLPELLDLPDPSLIGDYKINTFYYGSKNNPKREEYQEGNTAVTTETVNIAYYFGNIDTDYWGYSSREVPINGKVWYPDKEGEFPLILCVHGNHKAKEYSEFGYDYLGKLLASRGYIFSTVDQNFLNQRKGRENDARAILMLHHAKTILSWNYDDSTPLYGKIDTNNIALIGHSRGGEAVVTAALFNKLPYYLDNGNIKFNWDLPIKTVISLSPVEGQYRPGDRPLSPSYVDYLLMHGSHDGDVDSFKGARFFNRNLPDKGHFRSWFWIYGANHAQFNTTWANEQDPDPSLEGNLLDAYQQQRIAKLLISAFIEVSIKGDTRYKDLFKDFRTGLHWLPQTLYINRYQDNSGKIIADFDDDILLETATLSGWYCTAGGFSLWKENELYLNKGTQESWALFLKWRDEPAGFSMFSTTNPVFGDTLVFDLAVISMYYRDDEYKELFDFTIKIGTRSGDSYKTTLKEHFAITEVPKVWLTDKEEYDKHVVTQTIHIPLNKIDGWEKNQINYIEFVFDKSENCYIALDNILIK